MSDALRHYNATMFAVTFVRNLNGGALPDDLEAKAVEVIDELWNEMTEAEQVEAEMQWQHVKKPEAKR